MARIMIKDSVIEIGFGIKFTFLYQILKVLGNLQDLKINFPNILG